jgi:hypothetical protein
MGQATILEQVAKSFEGFGLQVMKGQEGVKQPYEAILVEFGADDEDRPLILQVLSYSQQIISSIVKQDDAPPSDLNVLTFLMTIPVEVSENCILEVLRLVALSNKALPFGCFNYSENEKVVYFTYSLPLFFDPPSEMTLLTVVHTILFAKETFMTVIEEVAVGKESVASLVENVGTAAKAK